MMILWHFGVVFTIVCWSRSRVILYLLSTFSANCSVLDQLEYITSEPLPGELKQDSGNPNSYWPHELFKNNGLGSILSIGLDPLIYTTRDQNQQIKQRQIEMIDL